MRRRTTTASAVPPSSSPSSKTTDFIDIPVWYFRLEDQWVSHYAHAHGWTNGKSSTKITVMLDETHQHHALVELKDEFFIFPHPKPGRPIRRPACYCSSSPERYVP